MSDLFGIGTALSSIFNLAGVNMTNSANKDIAAAANEHDLQMWKLNNEYNLPVNQIQRMRDAGINPSLAMAEGAGAMINAQSSSPLPTAHTATMVAPDFSALAGLDQLSIQRDLANSEIAKNEAEANDINKTLPKKLQAFEEQMKLVKKQQDEIDAKIEEVKSRINNTDEDTRLKWFQRYHMMFEEGQARKQFDLQLKQFNQSLAEFQQFAKESNAKIAEMSAHIGLMKSEEGINNREFNEMWYTFGERYLGLQLDNKAKKFGIGKTAREFQLLGFDIDNMQFLSDTGYKGLYNAGKAGRLAVKTISLGTNIINDMSGAIQNAWKSSSTGHKVEAFKEGIQGVQSLKP